MSLRIWAAGLLATGLLLGCERSAGQTPGAGMQSTPDLPTPRSASTAALAPTMVQASNTPAGEAARSPVPTIGAAAAAIRRVENGQPVLVESGKLEPLYRASRDLERYQTATWTYIFDPQSSQIIEIAPVNETALTEGAALPVAALEQQARDFIGEAAPQVQLAGLRPAHSQAGSNLLFRWEDPSLRALDDGQTAPFIQVALSPSGQLLNYINTLPLGE